VFNQEYRGGITLKMHTINAHDPTNLACDIKHVHAGMHAHLPSDTKARTYAHTNTYLHTIEHIHQLTWMRVVEEVMS